MAARTPRLRCPKCGSDMNHHADKLVFPTDVKETEHADPELQGVVQETYGCPACGNVEFRPAPAGRREQVAEKGTT